MNRMREFLTALLAAVPTVLVIADYVLYQRITWWLFVLWVLIMAFAIAMTFSTDGK